MIAGVLVARAAATGFGNGTQPWPSSTARRIARLLLPPTQIGGCGWLTGRGRIVTDASPEVPALDRDRVLGPHPPHHLDALVEQLVALVELHAQRAELRAQVAGRDAEDHPTVRERVERRHALRREERVAVRGDVHVGLQPQRRRRRGRERQPDERLERVVTTAFEPLVVGGGMVRHVDGVEARRFGRRGHLPDRRAGDELVRLIDVIDREPHAESHGRTLPSRPPTAPGGPHRT